MVAWCYDVIQENYLDIWAVANEVIGNPWIFLGIALLLLNIYAAKQKVPFEVMVLFNLLVGIAFFAKAQSMILIWVVVALLVGGLFYPALAKFINK